MESKTRTAKRMRIAAALSKQLRTHPDRATKVVGAPGDAPIVIALADDRCHEVLARVARHNAEGNDHVYVVTRIGGHLAGVEVRRGHEPDASKGEEPPIEIHSSIEWAMLVDYAASRVDAASGDTDAAIAALLDSYGLALTPA